MISPETIALVRERTDIVAVITEGVSSLKRRGRSFVGLCPFHKEKSPSFHVNPDRGFFHCFGCKESGSAIDFLMKHEGYTFPEAVRALAERAGIPIEEERGTPQSSEADRQRKAREDLYAVNALAATFFEQELRKNEHREYALEELARRGLVPGKDPKIDEVLQAFRIGYAPGAWDGLTTFLKAQGVSPVAAETVGLLVPRSSGSGYYDRFRHRLMFAVVDPQGRVVAFSGRALRELPAVEPRPGLVRLGPDAQDPDAHKPPKYINSPESPIYTKGQMLFGIHQARHSIRQEELAVLVEGNFDVVSLHALGITNVVAPLGTAFTTDQAKLLKRSAPDIVFLFDGDAAGRKAARLSREAVRAAGLSARVADLPNGIDPDELARTKGKQAVVDLLASAKGLLEALIQMSLDESFTQADAYEKQARIAFVAKLIAEEDDPMV
ncbi:MAG TPA: DNA primase, partial [Labilithrix sp.]|nr:DNA primase [Labilithrix sp.]